MRYRHGPGDLIGIILNEKAVPRWAMSPHICSRLMKDMVVERFLISGHHLPQRGIGIKDQIG